VFLFLVIPITQALLLLNSILFHGDFRLILYVLPLSCLSWIFRYLDYYFYAFVDINTAECREMVTVTCKTPLDSAVDIVTVSSSDLNFELTEKGVSYAQDIPAEFLVEMTALWKTLAAFDVFKLYYFKYYSYLNLFCFLLRVLFWSLFVFYMLPQDSILSTSTWIIVKPFVIPPSRAYATQAFRVKKGFQKALENKTQGAYKKPHPVTTDTEKADEKKEIPFLHQPTHGKGTSDNPSKPLHHNKDLEGKDRPQNAVPPKEPVSFAKSWLGKPIPGSNKFYENPDVKANLNKYFPEIPPKNE
jgi:hypothetical protein